MEPGRGGLSIETFGCRRFELLLLLTIARHDFMSFLERWRDVDGVFDLAAMTVGFVCRRLFWLVCWSRRWHGDLIY